MPPPRLDRDVDCRTERAALQYVIVLKEKKSEIHLLSNKYFGSVGHR